MVSDSVAAARPWLGVSGSSCLRQLETAMGGVLKDILPSLASAISDYDRLPVAERGEMSPPLSDEERSRRRYIRSVKCEDWLMGLGVRFGPALSLWFQLLPPDERPLARALLKRLGLVAAVVEEKETRRVLKELTTVAKKHGDILFPATWMHFVNLEIIGGYLPATSLTAFTAELKEWATGDVIHQMPDESGADSESEFLRVFRLGVREFLGLSPSVAQANQDPISLDTFCRDPDIWMRSGASRERKTVEVQLGPSIAHPRRNKVATGLARTPESVAAILRVRPEDAPVQELAAVMKREGGKVRAVVNADDELYLRMSYVSTWLEAAMKRHPCSTLFMSQDQTVEMWDAAVGACSAPTVKLPLDQSHFDWQENRRMLAVLGEEIERFIQISFSGDRAIRDDLAAVARTITYQLSAGDAFMTVRGDEGSDRFRVTKGIMSGWRWTALLDTICNYGEMYCARRLVERWVGIDPVCRLVVQGDDDKVECVSYGLACLLVRAYQYMGLDLNPVKFFADTTRDEFLRQVAQATGVCGYLGRALLSILWRNPIALEPPPGALRAREQLAQWSIVIGRGAYRPAALRCMREDIGKGNGLSGSQVTALLETPASAGGLGALRPDSASGLELRELRSTEQDASIVLGSAPMLSQVVMRWRELGVPMSWGATSTAMLARLEVPGLQRPTVSAQVSAVSWPPPWCSFSRAGGVPLAARANPELPRTLRDLALRTAIAAKDWQWIRDVYVCDEHKVLSNWLWSHASRRLWLSWVDGSLHFATPVCLGFATTFVSYMHSRVVAAAWSTVLSAHKPTMSAVLGAAVHAEDITRRMVSSHPRPQRG